MSPSFSSIIAFAAGVDPPFTIPARRVEELVELVSTPFLRGAAGAGMRGWREQDELDQQRRRLFAKSMLICDYILLAEFDIDEGSVLRHEYPLPTGCDGQ